MKIVHVAVGLLLKDDRVCLSLRQAHQSHAHHWEFPGGKMEAGERPQQCLQREFREELAIETADWLPLIEVPWQYEHVTVKLYVFTSRHFVGEPQGNEGQQIAWCPINRLADKHFPAANRGIIMALNLPDSYMISGDFSDAEDALVRLEEALQQGIRLCQLRAKSMNEEDFISLAQQATELVHAFGGRLLLNGAPELLDLCPEADGIQLASNRVFDFNQRPIAASKLLGVSTHSQAEITQALAIGADFLLLSPVKETRSHPGMAGIGWARFAEVAQQLPIPVYALGGMQPSDVQQSKQLGGQGVAAISGFWPNSA